MAKSFSTLQDLFSDFKLEDKGGYITQEFQDFGYRLAMQLDDMKHKSLYMRMAKEVDRGLLETALSYVSDAQARSKARLFMWKLKSLGVTLPRRTSRPKAAKKKLKKIKPTEE